jgi:hypothetical protein
MVPKGDRLILYTPFALKDKVKKLPGALWAPAPIKVWHVPATVETAGAIYRMASEGGIAMDCDPATLELMDRYQRSDAAQANKTAAELPEIPGRYCECSEATRQAVERRVQAAEDDEQGMCLQIHGGCGRSKGTWLHQRQAFWFAEPRDGTGLGMDMGEMPHRTPVLTPDGWVPIGTLEVGDEVIGSDGKAHRVTVITELEGRPLVRVVLKDGAEVECSATHRWTVRTHDGRWQTATSQGIADSLAAPGRRSLTTLPALAPVEFCKLNGDLPLDPYVLGVLLADGSFTRCCVGAGREAARFTSGKPHVVKRLEVALPVGVHAATDSDGVHHHLRPAELVRPAVHELGLCGVRSADKFIPSRYLRASIQERQELLRGLMDCDGTADGRSYGTTSSRLAEDVSELARSLGGAGSVKAYQRKKCIIYAVRLGLFDAPTHRHHSRRIIRVEATDRREPMRCIGVDAEDELYVTDGYVLTRNTGKSKVLIALAEQHEAQRMIILAPERPLKVWPKQFRIHGLRDWIVSNHGGYYKAGPRKGKPKFQCSMRDRITQAEENLRRAEQTGQPFCMVVNYASAWQEPMRSWLLQPPWMDKAIDRVNRKAWDIAAIDEGHFIKAAGGKWSMFAAELGQRSNRRYDLTGTPMPHSEPDIYAQGRFLDPGVFGTSFKRFRDHYFEMGGFEGRAVQGFKDEDTETEFLRKLGSMFFFVAAEDVLDLPASLDLEPIVFPLGAKARAHYEEMADDYIAQIGDKDDNDPVVARNTLAQMVRLSQITSGHLPVGVHCNTCSEIPDMDCKECGGTGISGQQIIEVDDTKAKELEEALNGLPLKEKVVVFGRFIHDLNVIQRAAETQGRRYREVSGRRSDGLDDDGMMVEDVDVIGVQLQAGGTGVDMTRARYAIYYSLDFNLGNYKQTKARVHRPGQKRETFYLYLTAEGTIDEIILNALLKRDDVIKSVIKAARTGELTA